MKKKFKAPRDRKQKINANRNSKQKFPKAYIKPKTWHQQLKRSGGFLIR